jgi:hypothetical protein
VLAWPRVRFVRFAGDELAETTMAMLAECFAQLGGVPKVVLADRMACLKGGVVANVVVPTPAYVRFASHYRFRPDFCEANDPESLRDRGTVMIAAPLPRTRSPRQVPARRRTPTHHPSTRPCRTVNRQRPRPRAQLRTDEHIKVRLEPRLNLIAAPSHAAGRTAHGLDSDAKHLKTAGQEHFRGQ